MGNVGYKEGMTMIQVKCIEKFRDKKSRIYGYRIQDINGQTQDVTPDDLKNAIKNGKIQVVNLTLTSDGRLIDSNKKQLINKKIMSNNIQKQSSVINDDAIENVIKAIANKVIQELNKLGVNCSISNCSYEDEYDGNIVKHYFTTPIGYLTAKHKLYYSDVVKEILKDQGVNFDEFNPQQSTSKVTVGINIAVFVSVKKNKITSIEIENSVQTQTWLETLKDDTIYLTVNHKANKADELNINGLCRETVSLVKRAFTLK